ncbi:hypothetical protein L2K20_09965 [Mycobacterium sp. MBM]|nr:hypothetical protein [Mycobacterium sp. MBM]
MTAALIILDGHAVTLTDDGSGLAGHVDIDGVRHRVFATITPTVRTVSPAKWRAAS